MKICRLILLLVNICIFNCVIGQEINSLDYRFVYEYVYKSDTISHKTKNDLFFLDVKHDKSVFYSYYTRESEIMRSTTEGKKKWRELFRAAVEKEGKNTNSFPHKRSTFKIWKNNTENVAYITDNLGYKKFLYKDSIKNIIWEIQDSVKWINNIPVQSARCSYHGRKWNVWFAMDLPWQEGPWMLCGLPGLIIEAYDVNQHHRFTLIKIEEKTIDDFDVDRLEGELIDRKSFLKQKRKYLMNIGNRTATELGIDGFSNKSELKYNFLETDYDDIENN